MMSGYRYTCSHPVIIPLGNSNILWSILIPCIRSLWTATFVVLISSCMYQYIVTCFQPGSVLLRKWMYHEPHTWRTLYTLHTHLTRTFHTHIPHCSYAHTPHTAHMHTHPTLPISTHTHPPHTACIKDLIRSLRDDDSSCEIRRQLGKACILQRVASWIALALVLPAGPFPFHSPNLFQYLPCADTESEGTERVWLARLALLLTYTAWCKFVAVEFSWVSCCFRSDKIIFDLVTTGLVADPCDLC